MKRAISILVPIVWILSLLSGCTTKTMPVDFDISFTFWTNEAHQNIYDTYNDTIQKDLVLDGTVSTDLVVTDDLLSEIYQMVLETEVMSIHETMTSENLTTTEVVMNMTPMVTYEIVITVQEETNTIRGDSTAFEYVNESECAKQFCAFVDYMEGLYYSTDEYQGFPDASGGYM